jgi:hypothetical protein
MKLEMPIPLGLRADAAGHAELEAEGRAEREHAIAPLHTLARGSVCGHQMIARLNLDHRDVRERIGPDHGAFLKPPIVKLDRDARYRADHVRVGDDVTGVVKHPARPARPAPTSHLHVHHARLDALGDVPHRVVDALQNIIARERLSRELHPLLRPQRGDRPHRAGHRQQHRPGGEQHDERGTEGDEAAHE